MPGALPKGLRSEQVIRAFEKAGGLRRAGKGSHTNLKMPNGQLITIPGHGDIKSGLLLAVIKKAGISVDEFLELVGRQ